MTATLDRAFPRLEPQHLGPLRTSMGEPVGSAWRIRWRGVLWLLPLAYAAGSYEARPIRNERSSTWGGSGNQLIQRAGAVERSASITSGSRPAPL